MAARNPSTTTNVAATSFSTPRMSSTSKTSSILSTTTPTASKTSTSSSRPSNVTTPGKTTSTVSVQTTLSTRPNTSSLKSTTSSVLTGTSTLSVLTTELTLTSPPCFPTNSPLNCSFPINDKQEQSNQTSLIIGLTIALCLSAIIILMIVCFMRRSRVQRHFRRRVKNNSDLFNKSEKDTRPSVYCNSFIQRDVIPPVLNSTKDLKSVPLSKVENVSNIYTQVSKTTPDHKRTDGNFNVSSKIYTEASPGSADTNLSGTYYVLEQDNNYIDGEYLNSNSIQKQSFLMDNDIEGVNIDQEYINSESLKKGVSLVHREEINTALYNNLHKEESSLAFENPGLADDRNAKSQPKNAMAEPRYWNQTRSDSIERSSVTFVTEDKNERKNPDVHDTEDCYINVQHDKSSSSPDNTVLKSVPKIRETYANEKLLQKDLTQVDYSNDGSQLESGSRNPSENYAKLRDVTKPSNDDYGPIMPK